MSASEVFALVNWWEEKHHQRKLHSVKTILGTSLLERNAATKCSLHKGTTSMRILLTLCHTVEFEGLSIREEGPEKQVK